MKNPITFFRQTTQANRDKDSLQQPLLSNSEPIFESELAGIVSKFDSEIESLKRDIESTKSIISEGAWYGQVEFNDDTGKFKW